MRFLSFEKFLGTKPFKIVSDSLFVTSFSNPAIGLFLLAIAPGWQSASQTAAASAMAEIQAGHYRQACELLHGSLRQTPKDAELWNLLGIAETELDERKAAEEAFQKGLEIAPGSASLNENAGLLFFREAKYEQAKERLERATQLGSKKPGVLFSLAAAKLRVGEAVEALKELKSLEPALSSAPEYWEERGRAELLHDAPAAETSFERALELSPNSVVALNSAATAAERQGLDEKALAYLIRARSAAPDHVPSLTHFAEVCIRRDLGPDAIAALEKARRLEPSNMQVVYLLGRANISVQNWQQAYDLFQEFSKDDSGYAPAYYAMGWLDIRLNRLDDARRQLERALQLEPHLSDARYELAQLEFDDGQVDRAQKLLQTVLRENPRHAKANMTMGDILLRKGDLAGAQKFLEAATRENPKLAAAHYKLSVVYQRERETEKSAAEKTLAANLNEEEKRSSKTQLRLVLPEASR